jgi:hypothetical protein
MLDEDVLAFHVQRHFGSLPSFLLLIFSTVSSTVTSTTWSK